MILLEFKEDVLNRMFDEVDDAKKHLKKTKLALCDIEDLLCELYESPENEEESHEDEYEDGQEYGDVEVSNNDIEVNYRRRRGMRGGMRGGMRHSRYAMRRRSAMGRYSY